MNLSPESLVVLRVRLLKLLRVLVGAARHWSSRASTSVVRLAVTRGTISRHSSLESAGVG